MSDTRGTWDEKVQLDAEGVAKILARCEVAAKTVQGMAAGRERFTMSIPARPEVDLDLVVCRLAKHDVPAVLSALGRALHLLGELQRSSARGMTHVEGCACGICGKLRALRAEGTGALLLLGKGFAPAASDQAPSLCAECGGPPNATCHAQPDPHFHAFRTDLITARNAKGSGVAGSPPPASAGCTNTPEPASPLTAAPAGAPAEGPAIPSAPQASVGGPTPPAVVSPAITGSDAQIQHMVVRFLGWRLPEKFRPDSGISFTPTYNEGTPHRVTHKPIGTNLFDAVQAEEMVRHMIDGLPAAPGTTGAPARKRIGGTCCEGCYGVHPPAGCGCDCHFDPVQPSRGATALDQAIEQLASGSGSVKGCLDLLRTAQRENVALHARLLALACVGSDEYPRVLDLCDEIERDQKGADEALHAVEVERDAARAEVEALKLEVDRLQRARIGDAEIIGRETCAKDAANAARERDAAVIIALGMARDAAEAKVAVLEAENAALKTQKITRAEYESLVQAFGVRGVDGVHQMASDAIAHRSCVAAAAEVLGPWRAVQCRDNANRIPIDEYNVVRPLPKSKWGSESKIPLWEHFEPGGFTKAEAEAHVARLNATTPAVDDAPRCNGHLVHPEYDRCPVHDK